MATELATAWIRLVPTTQGIQGEMAEALGAPSEKAGEDAGKKSGEGFLSGWKGVATAAAGAALGAAFLSGFGNAVETGAAMAKLTATLDLTGPQAERAGQVAGDLYQSGLGDSMSDVSGSVDAVMSSIEGMRDASASELEGVTEAALNLAKGFDVDVAEAAQTAGTMINNGLAPDATGAMDLITASMQEVPKNLRGEVLPVMDEYSKHFAGLGLDGEQAMSMIVAASDNGAIGMDKVGDSLKEFQNLAGDLDNTGAQEAMSDLGLDAEKMASKISKGGPAAQDAMSQVVSALQGVEDPGQQSAAAIALFGAPLEDLSRDKIPGFLESLGSAQGGMGDTAGAANRFGEQVNSGPGTALAELQRSVETAFGSFLTTAMPAIQGLASFISENQWVIGALAAVLVGVLVPAFVSWTASVWAANAALLANPVTWIVVGIMALIAALVLLIANWDSVVAFVTDVFGAALTWVQGLLAGFASWWSGIWNSITSFLSTVWQGAILWFRTRLNAMVTFAQSVIAGFRAWWSSVWSAITGFLSSVWQGAVALFQSVLSGALNFGRSVLSGFLGFWRGLWSSVTGFLSTIWQGAVSLFQSVLSGALNFGRSILNGFLGFWQGLWSGLVSFFTGLISGGLSMFQSLLSGAISFGRSIIQGYLSFWMGIWSNVLSFLTGVGSNILSFLSNTWSSLVSGAKSMLGDLMSYVGGLPDRIIGFFSGAGSWLLDIGSDIIGGLIDGLKGAFSGVQDALGGLTDMLPDWKGPEERDKVLLKDAGGLVMGGFTEGLEESYGSVKASLNRFTADLPSSVQASSVDPAPSGEGEREVVEIRIDMRGAKLDSDKRVKQLSQDLASRVGEQDRARGRVNLEGATR